MKIVKDAKNWKQMEGNSVVEKKINSFLAYYFIDARSVASDQCLKETKELLKLPHNRIYIAKYLLDNFGRGLYFIGDGVPIDENAPDIKLDRNVSKYWTVAWKILAYINKFQCVGTNEEIQ